MPLRIAYVDHQGGQAADGSGVMNQMFSPNLTRRQALLGGGALVVSIAAPVGAGAAEVPGGDVKPPLLPPELDSWIAVRQDGSVIGYFGKVDVGLGIQVAIAQTIADELDVGVDQVRIVMGDTARTINQGGASGSTGLELGGISLRNAAAEARYVLVNMAAQKFGVPAGSLVVSEGVVSVPGDGARRVSYGELIGGRYFDVTLKWNGKIGNDLLVQGDAVPKNHADYRVVGHSIPRQDIANKLFGREVYISDLRVPGMLHGRMIRPAVAGAMPVQVHADSIRHLPDVQIVHQQGFLGVVAAKEWNAIRAARALRVEWSVPAPAFPAQDALYAHVQAAPVVGTGGAKPQGDVDAALAGAAKVVSATYFFPFQSHASMGPACAIADVRPDAATIWTGDQKPHYIRDGVAAITGLPVSAVHGIWLRGPGSYGRNDGGDAAMDAAVLSKAVGKPVRVQYMRADGTAWDPKGPASVHQVSAGLDAAGSVTGLRFVSKAFSRENIASHPDKPNQSLAGQFMGMQVTSAQVFDVPGEGYDFASHDLGWQVVPALQERASPLRTSHLRDPLGPQINFASESFIDELAVAAHADPVAFRVRYLKEPRAIAVIEAAAKAANWTPRAPLSDVRGDIMTGRGMAFAHRGKTRVAVITEVEVNRRTGRVWPRRWFVAHDCGLIVNPDNLRLVIEGNILHATSRTLFEEVRFNPREVTSVDWLSYPILEARDAPESIDIVLIDHKEDLPFGAGEPSSRPVPAAIANAVFNATGVRFRQAPLNPERIKAALI
jgi:nicotinate dehydrogenase subunit B